MEQQQDSTIRNVSDDFSRDVLGMSANATTRSFVSGAFRLDIISTTADLHTAVLKPLVNGKESGHVTFHALDSAGLSELTGCLANPSARNETFAGEAALRKLLFNARVRETLVTSDLGAGHMDILSEFLDRHSSTWGQSEFESRIQMKEVAPGIVHLNLPGQYLLCSMFMRFQEHYESPEFKGKIFSHDAFKAWYRTSREHGEFSYYFDWAGFNIPSYVIEPFRQGRFDPLNNNEKAFLDRISAYSGKFYVIGTSGVNDSDTLRHEIAHGLYYTNDEYRQKADKILDKIDTTPIERYLERIGYHPDSWRDECHAYLGDSLKGLAAEGIDTKPYKNAHRALLRLYRNTIEKG
jgi:hypothetical protein